MVVNHQNAKTEEKFELKKKNNFHVMRLEIFSKSK